MVDGEQTDNTEPSTAAFPDVPLAGMSTHQPLSARGSPAQEAQEFRPYWIREGDFDTCALNFNTTFCVQFDRELIKLFPPRR